MADWQTDTTKSTFETDSVLKNYQEGRSRSGSGATSLSGKYGESTTTTYGVGTSWGNGQFDWTDLAPGGVHIESDTTTTGYDMVGIKASEVEPMRSAIRDYVTRVQKTVDSTLNTNDQELNKAVRGGEVRKAVNEYIDKVKLYCQNVTSGLLVFSDKLADVGNAWITATENMGSTISSSTSSFSEGSAYSDDVQYRGQA